MTTRSRPRSNTLTEENLGLSVSTCIRLNCFIKGPHHHNNNNALSNYNFGNKTPNTKSRNNTVKSQKPFRLSNVVGINEKAVTRQSIKNYRNQNRASAKKSLRNNLKRHSRRI